MMRALSNILMFSLLLVVAKAKIQSQENNHESTTTIEDNGIITDIYNYLYLSSYTEI